MVIQWHLTALTVSLIGVGVYLLATHSVLKGNGGAIRLPAMVLTAIFLLIGIIGITTSIGNPERILNVLGNLKAGFSMGLISSCALFFIAIYIMLTKKITFKTKLVYVLGIILGLLIVIGNIKIYMKPARPALFHWSIYLFFASYAVSIGTLCYAMLKTFTCEQTEKSYSKVMVAAICAQLLSIIAFIINLLSIGTSDRLLNIAVVNSGLFAATFYGIVIFLGIIIPLIFAIKFVNHNKLFTLTAFICNGIGGIVFAAMLNITKI